MKGNTLFVRFDDIAHKILQSHLKLGLISVGWDHEWIVNGPQEILDAVAAELKEKIPWTSFHTVEDNKRVWHSAERDRWRQNDQGKD